MERWFPPRYANQGADQTFRAGGAMRRDSCKCIAQLPQGLAKGWELALPLTEVIPWRRTERGTTEDPFPGDRKTTVSHKAA